MDDALSRWLAGPGLATLDVITGSALDVIAVLDRQLTLRYINWTGQGLTREAVIGGSVLDLVPPDYRHVSRDAYLKVLQTGIGTRFETIYKDSQDIHMWEVHVGPIRDQDEVVGIIAINSNVTEQRRAHADRDRFFSLSLDMLVVVSPDARFKRSNPAFGEALGYEEAELIGRPFSDFVHPEDRARTSAWFASASSGSRVIDLENRYLRRGGELRVFSWRATVDPITGDLYAVARDVTAHRTMESQLRHAQKMEAVGQLAGGIAHDFNNLLLAILGNTELAMQCAPQSAELLECLTEIEGASRRAADLTKQLLAFSRRQPLRPVAVDLNQLIAGLMKMLRRLLPESIAIDLIPGHDLATVNADTSQLEQVIVNLSVNARDAMQRGGQLTIETENVLINGRYCELHPWARPGRYVLLNVSDTGVGMPAEVRERIFEPFFTTKAVHQGTGLGLATVYGIVQQHEGLIHVYSEPGVGSTFKIYLPAHSRLATEHGTELQAAPPRGQETLLLAEDDERVRRVTVQVLRRAGYRTIVAANGAEAIQLLREAKEPVHLVLLDVIMPELGGAETWQQLRALRPGLRVLFTSGYADERCLERLPPDAEVIEKPFRAEELLTRIRSKLDS